MIIDTIIAEIFCKQTDGIEAVPVKGTEEDTVFCIEKGNTEITELINDGLAKVKENGTYGAAVLVTCALTLRRAWPNR